MLKKRKHKFMAFLLSAMMLITGTAMGAAPAAAAEKSPPALKSCSANFGYDFVLSFDTSTDAEWMSKITSVTVAGESWTKGNTSYSVWNNKTIMQIPTSSTSGKASPILQLPASSLQTATVI